MRGGDVQVCPRFLRHSGRCRYRDRQSVRRPTTLASRECGISTSCRWGRPPTPTSEGRGWRGATRSNYGPLCASPASARASFPGRSVKHVCPGSPFRCLMAARAGQGILYRIYDHPFPRIELCLRVCSLSRCAAVPARSARGLIFAANQYGGRKSEVWERCRIVDIGSLCRVSRRAVGHPCPGREGKEREAGFCYAAVKRASLRRCAAEPGHCADRHRHASSPVFRST